MSSRTRSSRSRRRSSRRGSGVEAEDTKASMPDSEKDPSSAGDDDVTITSTSSSERKRRPSASMVADRIWEKDQLRDVNMRLSNLLANYEKDGAIGPFFTHSDFEELKKMNNEIIERMEGEFKQSLDRKAGEITDLKQANADLEEDNGEMREEMADLKGKMSRMQKELARFRGERDAERKDKEKALHELETDRETLMARERRLIEENARLSDKLASIEDIYRQQGEDSERDFAARLQQELQLRDGKTAAERAEWQAELEERFNELKSTHAKRIEELMDDLARKDDQLGQLETDVTETAKERDGLRRDLATERSRRDMAEKDLRMFKHAMNKDLDEERKKYQDLEDAYNLQCEQMFSFQQINKNLHEEIEDLKRKLDMFEDKMGIDSPISGRKRRRRDPSVMTAVDIVAVDCEATRARRSFPLENVNRQYSGDWQGFELQNVWPVPINVSQLSLINNVDGSEELALPDKVIHPSGIIRVCLTDRKKQDTDLVWKGVETDKHSTQELWVVDKEGGKVLIDTVPPGNVEVDGTCRVM